MKRCPLTQDEIAEILNKHNMQYFAGRYSFMLGYEEALNAPGQLTGALTPLGIDLEAKLAIAVKAIEFIVNESTGHMLALDKAREVLKKLNTKPVAVVDIDNVDSIQTHGLYGEGGNKGTLIVWPKEISGHPPKD